MIWHTLAYMHVKEERKSEHLWASSLSSSSFQSMKCIKAELQNVGPLLISLLWDASPLNGLNHPSPPSHNPSIHHQHFARFAIIHSGRKGQYTIVDQRVL